jgi:hypothetical protein
MAINPQAVASWGLLAAAGGGGSPQVVSAMEITVSAAELLEVALEAPEISVELSDEQ